jgi:hypothetical protein
MARYGTDGLPINHYAIAAGELYWWLAATNSNEEYAWIIVIYAEYLDSLQQEKVS